MPRLIRAQWWKDEASRCFFPIGISAGPVFWVAFSALKLLVECEWQEGHSAHQNTCATYTKGSLLEQVGTKTEGKLTDPGSPKKAVNIEVMVWWSTGHHMVNTTHDQHVYEHMCPRHLLDALITVLHPTQHKICHFADVSKPMSWLGMEKLSLT